MENTQNLFFERPILNSTNNHPDRHWELESSGQDSSIKGYKSMLKSNPDQARQMAREIIKNTYRTLMTRGMKGCYLYCVDKELGEYLKGVILRKN